MCSTVLLSYCIQQHLLNYKGSRKRKILWGDRAQTWIFSGACFWNRTQCFSLLWSTGTWTTCQSRTGARSSGFLKMQKTSNSSSQITHLQPPKFKYISRHKCLGSNFFSGLPLYIQEECCTERQNTPRSSTKHITSSHLTSRSEGWRYTSTLNKGLMLM